MANVASLSCAAPWRRRPCASPPAAGSFGLGRRRAGIGMAARLSTRSQLVGFKARRAVNIPYIEQRGCPGEDYVKEVERIVRVAFPDSSRIEYLGNNNWCSKLKPITFFSVSATPFCYLRVFYKESSEVLQLESDKLVLEFLGVSGGMDDLGLQFTISGDLGVSSGRLSSTKFFQGSVFMELKCDLPFPFSLMPEPIVLPVGDSVLDSILGAMENALLNGLVADYNRWCRIKSNEQKQQDSRRAIRAAPS